MAKVMALNDTVHDSRETSPHLKKERKRRKKGKEEKRKEIPDGEGEGAQ
jgi:hypothetical protein